MFQTLPQFVRKLIDFFNAYTVSMHFLMIHYRTRFVTVRVLLVPARVLPSLKPADLYEVVEERKDDPVDWLG